MAGNWYTVFLGQQQQLVCSYMSVIAGQLAGPHQTPLYAIKACCVEHN